MKALQIEDAVQMLNSTNVVYSRAGGGAGSILLVKTDNNNSIFLLRKSKKVIIFAGCLQKMIATNFMLPNSCVPLVASDHRSSAEIRQNVLQLFVAKRQGSFLFFAYTLLQRTR